MKSAISLYTATIGWVEVKDFFIHQAQIPILGQVTDHDPFLKQKINVVPSQE